MKRGAWVLLIVILGGALIVGSRGDGEPPTAAERSDQIARTVRCPTCRGLSAAESDARAAVAVRDEIRRRVDAGEGDDEIRAYLVSRYGDDILLVPESDGVSAFVWALPVGVLVVGLGTLSLAFRRWRRELAAAATPEDERLVERERRR